MKKFPILTVLLATIILASCDKKIPDYANSIPDKAFLVGTMHPQQLFDKGQISDMESIKDKIDDTFLRSIFEDPGKSGLVLNQYMYFFMYFMDDDPIIGTIAGIDDLSEVKDLLRKMSENDDFVEEEALTFFFPDNENSGLAWDSKMLISLSSPDEAISSEMLKSELIKLFQLEKEDAVTSIVDFNNFSGKMEDLNIWFTGDELKKVLEKTGTFDDMDISLPFELYNNYGQVFFEFDEGAMFITSETHLSDEVEKGAEMFLVAKDNLNSNLLDIAPGNDLLLAMAYSVDLEKMSTMMKNFMPSDIEGVPDKIEEVTGMKGNELIEALNGDFVLAVNGAPEGSMLPIEIMIGIGLDDESLQDKMMGTVGNMAAVEQEGDFFTININGMEIYSGIIDGIWVITNANGYKEAISGKGLEKTLNDSKFKEYAGGSMGMYMNLDLTSYPAQLQAMLAQGGAPEMLDLLTESFLFLGMEASNYESKVSVITSKKDENSLHTILKVMEHMD